MKKLVLTGLATEHDLAQPLRDAQYFLVFNNGELRVPVSEKAAEIVLQGMVTESDAQKEVTEEPGDELPDDTSYATSLSTGPEIPYDPDDGVNQI